MYGTMKPGDTRIEWHDGIASLEDMQAHVGGYIEYVSLSPGATQDIAVVCNEEGKLTKLEPCLMNPVDPNDVIVGPVLFVGSDMTTGESRAITQDEADALGLLPSGLAWRKREELPSGAVSETVISIPKLRTSPGRVAL